MTQMHRDRKRVFVDRLGWQVPVIEGEFEIDQFDGPDALYLLSLDERGNHEGSLRLLPTTKPHLLSEVFPHLCEREVPRGPRIWEITRLCTAPDLADPRRPRREIFLGVIELALARGIKSYTSMTHVPYLSAVLAAGWDCEPLGLPQEDLGVMVGALIIHITPDTLDLIRARTGVTQPVLSREASNAA
jgi:acyl-homoserine lactone synthase